MARASLKFGDKGDKITVKLALDCLPREKRSMAANIRDECLSNGPIKTIIADPTDNIFLSHILHILLNPELEFLCQPMMDWIKWLVAGGMLPEEFRSEVQKYDNATHCGQVWTADVVAFRCRTCGVSPSMSLCEECFNSGNHEGHDFSMFKSLFGGACDCGCSSVMIKTGFCPKHGRGEGKSLRPPQKLIACAEAVLPRVILRFILMCRQLGQSDASSFSMKKVRAAFSEYNFFFEYIEGLLEMGAVMRAIIRKILLNKQYFQESLHPPKQYEFHKQLKQCVGNYLFNIKDMPMATCPAGFEDIGNINNIQVHETFLDEIIFWMVKFEFPQKLICFLLNMKPDAEYEKEFARAFVSHYSRLSKSIERSETSDELCENIVHISVQLFSNQSLAFLMSTNYNLLYVVILSIRDVFTSTLEFSSLYGTLNDHNVVMCGSNMMLTYTFFPLISDLNSIISIKAIAEIYIRDERLFNLWHTVVAMFQGMNLTLRVAGDYKDYNEEVYNPEVYMAAFRAESEACAMQMWTVAAYMGDPKLRSQVILMTQNCLKHILVWFENTKFSRKLFEAHPNMFSFHVPLHRHYSCFLWNAVKYQKISLEEILPEKTIFENLILHPLIVLYAAFSEIIGGQWARIHQITKHPASFYTKSHFANSMIDLDIFLIQLAAMTMRPDDLLHNIIRIFKIKDSICLTRNVDTWLRVLPNVESFLLFISTIATARTYLDDDDNNTARREMTALLSMRHRTHSYFMENMPVKSSSDVHDKNFEGVLKELSIYDEPYIESNTQIPHQGLYRPKQDVWLNNYDPLHSKLRSVCLQDYHGSLSRFNECCRANGKLANDRVKLWPPYRLPSNILADFVDPRRLISSRYFQALLLVILYNSSNTLDESDKVLALTIFLLEMVVDYQATNNCSTDEEMYDLSEEMTRDAIPIDCYRTDDIFVNSTIIVHRAPAYFCSPKAVPVSNGTSDSILHSYATNHLNSSDGTSSSDSTLPPDDDVTMQTDSSQDMDINQESSPIFRNSTGTTNIFTCESSASSTDDVMDCSIITLLLKIHSKLIQQPDSSIVDYYIPDFGCTKDSRIGDRSFFVAKLLNKLGRHNKNTADHIMSLIGVSDCQTQQAMEIGKEEQSAETKDEVRKSKANERRKRIMARFAEQQMQFLKKNTVDYEAFDISSDTAEEPEEVTFSCAICNKTTPSTRDKPMGLIYYSQRTSILAYRSDLESPPTLPATYNDLNPTEFTFLGKHMDERTSDLKGWFGKSASMVVNCWWEGGVHVQSCGHYLHIQCHKSYVESLPVRRSEDGAENYQMDEFACPLCRHIANGILPVGTVITRISADSNVKFSQTDNRELVIDRILKYLTPPKFGPAASSAMTEVTRGLTTTYSGHRTEQSDIFDSALFMPLNSIIRTNLEIELVQRGGHLVNQLETRRRKLGCAHMVPLIYSLFFHAKMLSALYEKVGREPDGSRPWTRWMWSSVTLSRPDGFENAASLDKEIPMFFRDPFTILLQLIIMLPLKLELSLMDCIMINIYKLVILRATVDQLCRISEGQRLQLLRTGPLAPLFSMVYRHLEDSLLLRGKTNAVNASWVPESATHEVRQNCLEFLRMAALLKVFSRDQKVPFIIEQVKECTMLEKFIGAFDTCSVVNPVAMDTMCGTLNTREGNQPQLTLSLPCETWCTEVVMFAVKSQSTAVNLLKHKRFLSCRLLRFPPTYDELFQKYHHEPWSSHKILQNHPGICLVCGQLIQLPDSPRYVDNEHPSMKHATACGAGTAIYLSILQSYVYVAYKSTLLFWGSLHLDAFGEEDKDFKRGKTLYFNKDRADLLEELWINHRFDSIRQRAIRVRQ